MTDDASRIPTTVEAQRLILVASACEIGLIEALADGGTPERLAASLGLDLRATRILLRALAEARVAEADGGTYRLSEGGRTWLEEARRGRGFAHELHVLGNWTHLPEIARTGRQAVRKRDAEGIDRFMKAMAGRRPESVVIAVDLLAAALPPGRLLDLGGGPGLYSRALIERGWTATLVDTEQTIAHVRDAYGLDEVAGLTLCAVDFTKTLPPGDFDLALAANVVHIYDGETNAALMRRLADAYPSLAAIAVLDFVSGLSDGADLFAVNMLVHTEAGGTYTLDEITDWMGAAGFGRVVPHEVDRHWLVLATRNS